MLTSTDQGRRRLLLTLAALAGAMPATARGQGGHSPPGGTEGQDGKDKRPSKAEEFAKLSPQEKWQRRFPQSVLVSDLIGRKVLDGQQGVLGFVETVVTTPAGELHIAFARRRLLALRGETVVVPNVRAALLGPFVMLPELSDEEIARLPAFEASRYRAVDRGSRIRMALTKH